MICLKNHIVCRLGIIGRPPQYGHEESKVWKTETGPSQGGRAWPRGPKFELFEILPYRDH